MKRFFLYLFSLLTVSSAMADFTEAGYYRLKNVYTQRYVTVIDDKCEYVDFVTGKIDGHSLFTQQDFSLICHDPASIIYAAHISGSHYDVAAQGISLKNMMNYNIFLGENGKDGSQTVYRIYSTEKGVTKYLGDAGSPSKPTGGIIFGTPLATSVSSQKRCDWLILPVSASTDDYFGVLPTVAAGGGNWASLYCSFPISVYSKGVEFYYPCAKSSTGYVEMKKLDGVVPEGIPLVVKCGSTDPASNRLNVGGTSTVKAPGNLLKGQYFNCYANKGQYVNRIPNDKNTMRILGKCSDGSIGFILDETLDYIPANTAYMIVEPWYPKELKCVFSHEEFEAKVVKVIADEEPEGPKDVYSLTGMKILSQASPEEIAKLPTGYYIVGGKKTLLK